MSKHRLGWQDAELAELIGCDDVPIEDVVLSAEYLQNCPVCGKLLKLMWDVRVVEVDYPTREPAET